MGAFEMATQSLVTGLVVGDQVYVSFLEGRKDDELILLGKAIGIDLTPPPADHGTLSGLGDNDHPQYLLASSFTAANVFSMVLSQDGAGSGLDADTLDGLSSASFLLASSYTAADVLAKLLGVDGAGSGLDADMLDGINSTAFMLLAGGTLTGNLTLRTGAVGAGTSPLKFVAGTNMTTAEAGAMEWDGTNLFITQTTGPTRKTIAYLDSVMTGSTAKWTTARTVTFATGDVTGSFSIDGSAAVGNVVLTVGATKIVNSMLATNAVTNSKLSTASGEPGAVMSASTWTPTITATSFNAGTGVSASGQYIQIGKWVFCRGSITLGTTGFAAGTGGYAFSLPVAAQLTGYPTAVCIGSLRLSGMTSGHIANFSVPLNLDANGVSFRYPAAYPNGATTTVGAAAPVAVIASQRFEYSVIYEAA